VLKASAKPVDRNKLGAIDQRFKIANGSHSGEYFGICFKNQELGDQTTIT
jgi:hypothetical protein